MIQTELTDGRLFDTDAYCHSFDAVVTAVYAEQNTCRLVLDRTAFFPEGGGQLSDIGTLSGYAVTDVQETVRGIEHTVNAPSDAFRVGDTVHGEVDWATRFSAMQCHSAEHILSGIIHQLYGYDNVGFHLGREEMTVDTSGVLTKEQLDRVEDLANAAVYRQIPITVTYPSREELATLTYRSKIALQGRVCIVTIGDVDRCACCAPHVRSTGEIGLIRIVFAERHRGGMRLYVKAGERAARYVRAVSDELARISTMLSAHTTETADAVSRLLTELKDTTLAYKAVLHEQMRRRAEELCVEDAHPVERFSPDMPVECVRTFLNTAVERVRGIAVAILSKADGFTYLLASRTVDLKACIGDINRTLNGRGGGSSAMMQGTFLCSEDAIRSYFKSLVL